MPKQDLSEIIVVLDKSGSMEAIKTDAIGGFNSFLDAQKQLPGEAKFTLVLFSNEYDVKISGKNLKKIAKLTKQTYIPNGQTALLDALGKTIDNVGVRLHSIPEEERPEKVIFAILTDGEENASKEYTLEKINEMIKHQTEVYSWEFVFLAANQDAMQAGASLGIQSHNTFSFIATPKGIQDAYRGLNDTVSSYRHH